MSNRVLIFSGPSGGHLFPAQAFAETLREHRPNTQITLVTSVRAQGLCARFPAGIFNAIEYLPEFGLPAGFSFSGLKLFVNIPAAALQSWRMLSRIRPDLCVGFGSFVSYFGMLFAGWRKIPSFLHEQNQMPGRATRMLQDVIPCIAVSFPKTEFLKKPKRVVVTGLPVRRDLREKLLRPGQKKSEPAVILVCGGSQGSVFLNRAVLDAFLSFSPLERAQFAVIHITGPGQEDTVKREYEKMSIRAEVYPFFEQMENLYNRAHIAISRAGANSSYEQALSGIPTLFVPYPHAEGHQAENARWFTENGAALSIKQDDQSASRIAASLRAWLPRGKDYQAASSKMLELSQPDGHAKLFDLASEYLGASRS